MKLSNLFELDWKDFINGLLLAILGAVIGHFLGALDSGELLTINWKEVIVGAVSAGLGYILKRFSSNSEGEPLKK